MEGTNGLGCGLSEEHAEAGADHLPKVVREALEDHHEGPPEDGAGEHQDTGLGAIREHGDGYAKPEVGSAQASWLARNRGTVRTRGSGGETRADAVKEDRTDVP